MIIALKMIHCFFSNSIPIYNYAIFICFTFRYYKEGIKPLFQTVERLLSQSPNSIFLLCNQANRLNVNHDFFYQTLDDFGFVFKQIELSTFLQEVPIEKTYLFVISRSNRSNKE